MKLRYREKDGWCRYIDVEEIHLALWDKNNEKNWVEVQASDISGSAMITKWEGPKPIDYPYSLADSFIEKHGVVRGSK